MQFEEESEEEEGEDTEHVMNIKASGLEEENALAEGADKKELHPRSIDVYWLQRSLGKFY